MLFFPAHTPRSAVPTRSVFDVPTYRQVLPQLTVELQRARRYEHPLALLVMSPHDPASTRGPVPVTSRPVADTTPAIFFLLGSFLRNSLRETDIVAAAPETLSYAVALAETDRRGAERAVDRLRDGFRECGGAGLRVGVAEFPHDGLAMEDLLDSACSAWHTGAASERAPHADGGSGHG
jgi:hypothetical protein